MSKKPVRWAVKAPCLGNMLYVSGFGSADGIMMSGAPYLEDTFDTREEAEALAFEFVVYNPEDIGRVTVERIDVNSTIVNRRGNDADVFR